MNIHLYLLADGGNLPADVLAVAEKLLAKGRTQVLQAIFEPLLMQAFAVDSEAYAAVSWLGEGNDPADDCWMYADPVHFVLQRDYFSLAYPASLALTESERHTLLADINRHFNEEGLTFLAGSSGRWYLRLSDAPEISTSLPEEAAGHDVRGFQPQGPDAGRWKRVANELQMLLHQHPVNQAREARGDLAVNSLWLSGNGRLPKHHEIIAYQHIYARVPAARGLGMLAGAQVSLPVLPDGGPVSIADNSLIVLESARDDCAGWLRIVERSVQQGSRLSFHLVMPDKVITTDVRRSDNWKFWRSRKPLQSY